MKERLIRKLAILGSVRQLHAVELELWRYVGLIGAVAGSTWIFWIAPPQGALWIAYLIVLVLLLAIFQPWHRELHLSMDSSSLRLRRMAFGVVPLRSSDYALPGRRLAVERRVVPFVAPDDYSGCLLFVLPFPLSWILAGARSSKDAPSHVTEWVLCLRGVGHGTEDLARLKHAQVAASFLAAAEELLPEHVDRG